MEVTALYQGECTIAFTHGAVFIGNGGSPFLQRYEISGHGAVRRGSRTRVTTLAGGGGAVYVNGRTAWYVPRERGTAKRLEEIRIAGGAKIVSGSTRDSYRLTT
jgi:hypothetical protein